MESAVAALDEVFVASGKSEDRVRAIRAAAGLPDSKVAKAIGRGSRDADREVEAAAIEALRFLRNPTALGELHAWCRRNCDALRKEPERAAAGLRAIGQHGDPSSVEILADSPFETPGEGPVRARVFGLANIRTRESVEKRIGRMRLVQPGKLDSFMHEFRVAVFRLTGVDRGEVPVRWFEWWEENKKTLRVSADPPRLPPFAQRAWDVCWSREERERPRRRNPERGGSGG